jgi:hypothetical protein
MDSYYFKCEGIILAAVYAKSTKEAWEKLPLQHSWMNATKSNCVLTQVVSGTEWDRELEEMEMIKRKYL